MISVWFRSLGCAALVLAIFTLLFALGLLALVLVLSQALL